MSALDSSVRRRLASFPRASLGVAASPVESWAIEGRPLWVKRDDLNAPDLGGNKARALQFLFGPVPSGRTLLTVGGVGSMHVLATLRAASQVSLDARAYRWPHELNETGRKVAAAIVATGRPAPVCSSPGRAWTAATWRRLRHGDWWIPFGGSSPLGILGHVESALELAQQVRNGELPEPQELVVPFGTGGTAAGLALGLVASGLSGRLMAVRCGPSFGHERSWLRFLARRTAALLQLESGVGDAAVDRVAIDHSMFTDAYARPHPAAMALADVVMRERGVILDATYSAKACYAAVRRLSPGRPTVLFWHTFDARWMTHTHR